MREVTLHEFFVGEEDKCERLVAALQYSLECFSTAQIASREDLDAVNIIPLQSLLCDET